MGSETLEDVKRQDAPSVDKKSWICWIAIAAIVIGHFVFLMNFFEPAISAYDANGYFLQSTLIARDGKTSFETKSPLQYVNAHWVSDDNKTFYSQYSPGLPMILAAGQMLFGASGALLVNPIMASLTLLGLFLVCREWVGCWWGLVAAAVMAVNPVANQHSLWADSHTSVAFFLVFGLFFLIKWSDTLAVRWAIPAGLFLSMIPVIRAPEIVLGLGIAIFMISYWKHDRRFYVSFGSAVGAGLIPVTVLGIRNHLAFGAFWKSGYALTNEDTGFGWGYFLEKANPYLQGMMSEGAGFFAAIGVVGMVALCVRREHWRKGVLLLGMILPLVILYMAYYWQNIAMRFLLPGFFLLAIAGVWALKELTSEKLAQSLVLGVAVFLLSAAWGMPQSLQALERIRNTNKSIATATRFIEKNIPAGSMIASGNGKLMQHLDFIGKWDLLNLAIASGGDMKRRRPISAIDMGPGAANKSRQEELAERYSGRDHEKFFEDLDDWLEDDQKLFIIEQKGGSARTQQILWGGEEVASLRIPEAPVSEMSSAIRQGGRQQMGGLDRSRLPTRGPGIRSLEGAELTIAEWKVPRAWRALVNIPLGRMLGWVAHFPSEMGRLWVKHTVELVRLGQAPPGEVLTRVELIDANKTDTFAPPEQK